MIAAPIRWSVLFTLLLPSAATSQSLRLVDANGRERRCEFAGKPKRLPALGDVVDSTALSQFLGTTAVPDTTRLSLVFDGKDNPATIRPIDLSVLSAGLVDAVQSGLRAQNGAGLWAVRLRMISRPAVSIDLERSVYCPAQMDVATASVAATGRVMVRGGPGLQSPGNSIDIVAEVSIDAEGRPTQVLLRRRSNIPEMDDAIVRYYQTVHFLPALIDGRAIPSVFRIDGFQRRP